MRSDNLVPLLVPPPLPGMGFRQGTVESFNLDTGENVIDVGGAQLVNVPCLNVTDAAGLLPGMVVGLLTWKSSWWIIGRVAVPGTAGFADLTVRAADGGEVSFIDGEVHFRQGSVDGETSGRITAFQESAGRLSTIIIPPFSEPGTNHVIIEGATSASPGGFFVDTEGDVFVDADGEGTYQHLGAAGMESVSSSLFFDSFSQIQLNASGDQVFLTHQTTGNAANCHITSFGQILRSTSARRYKRDIRDLDLDPAAVLLLRPRSWLPREQTEARREPRGEGPTPPPSPPARNVGFIAEELDEIGLGEFVTYDAEGQPDAIAYDRLSAALVTVIQQQQQQIDALTARLDRLEAH